MNTLILTQLCFWHQSSSKYDPGSRSATAIYSFISIKKINISAKSRKAKVCWAEMFQSCQYLVRNNFVSLDKFQIFICEYFQILNFRETTNYIPEWQVKCNSWEPCGGAPWPPASPPPVPPSHRWGRPRTRGRWGWKRRTWSGKRCKFLEKVWRRLLLDHLL